MSLWQKDPESRSTSSSTPTATAPQASAPQPPRPAASSPDSRGTKPATIGQSIQINGELTGREDLIIDGKIDGKIVVEGHQLTIGANGRINAEVHAKSIQIHGQVSGNITADDKVEISPSGSVDGDITAPRVALADGSSFKGSIDMGRKPGKTSKEDTTSVNRDVPITAGANKS